MCCSSLHKEVLAADVTSIKSSSPFHELQSWVVEFVPRSPLSQYVYFFSCLGTAPFHLVLIMKILQNH